MSPLIDSEVLVHIGLHKTASSWMQEHLFTQEKYGFYGPARDDERVSHQVKDIGHKLVTGDDGRLINEWEFDAAAVRASLAEIETKPGLCPVVSYERLGGHPLSNGFDRAMICRRIKAVFPNVRILICIREQRAMLFSNYMQYLRNGGWNTPEAFIDFPSDRRQPTLSLKFWEYDGLIAMYHDVFGKDRTLVLPYEMFASEPDAFAARICAFAGVKPIAGDLPVRVISNQRKGHVSSYYSRFLTPLRKSSSANGYFPQSRVGAALDKWVKSALDRLVPQSWEDGTRKALEQRIEAKIGGYFRPSNQATRDLTGLDLGRYGYAL